MDRHSMTLFPTEQWLERYGRRLDASDALDDLSDGWGVGFDGDIRIVIEDIPLSGTTLGDLPDEALADIPENLRKGLADITLADAPSLFDETIRPALPADTRDLLVQLDEYVVDGTIHAHIGLCEGTVTDTEVLDASDAREAGFVFRGSLASWQGILDGRPVLSAMLSGDLQVEGEWAHLLRYSAMLQLFGELAAAVETTHLFGETRQPVKSPVLDAVARPPARLQRAAERRALRALDSLSPF